MIFVIREIDLSRIDDQDWGIVVVVEESCILFPELQDSRCLWTASVNALLEYTLPQNPAGARR